MARPGTSLLRSEADGRFGDALHELEAVDDVSLRAWVFARIGSEEKVLALTPGSVSAWEPLVRARLAQLSGDSEPALMCADDAAARARDAGDFHALARAEILAADVLFDRDGPVDGSAAVARVAAARATIQEQSLQGLEATLEVMLIRAKMANGNWNAAREAASKLLGTNLENSPEAFWRAAALLGTIHRREGGDVRARRSELQAVETLEGIALQLPRSLRDAFWSDPSRRALRLRASNITERTLSITRAAEEENVDPRMKRVLELLKRLVAERDLDRLLERVTDSAVELFGAERGFVLLPDESGTLQPRLIRSRGSEEDPSVAFSQSIAEAVLIDGQPILTMDAGDDGRLSEYLSVHKLMLRSVACVPIVAPGSVVGVLYLEHRMRRGRFAEKDLDLLIAFADQAGIALENARLLAELESRAAELERQREEVELARAEVERVLAMRTGELADAKRELDETRNALRESFNRDGIIGRSEPMRRLFQVLSRVSDSSVPVVIFGESGTGKELVARSIHYSSKREKGPFVALNCAAVPEALLESELFGHVRGAFTGADRDRDGVLVRADGGTLFLDEVGDMPMKMQVDLLRVLQESKVRPVGAEDEVSFCTRVVCASNKSLEALVKSGKFREDLYYRLNVVEVRIPPLRDRDGDVPLLAEHFLERIATQEGMRRRRLSREALAELCKYDYPGNVRQLEHLLTNAAVMADGDTIEVHDLPIQVSGAPAQSGSAVLAPIGPEKPDEAPPPDPENLSTNLDDFKSKERSKILEALEATGWNRAKAARALGIPRRTFYRRLKEYDIL